MDIFPFLILIRAPTILYLSHLGEIKPLSHIRRENTNRICYVVIVLLSFKAGDSVSSKWHITRVDRLDFQIRMLEKYIIYNPFIFLGGKSTC